MNLNELGQMNGSAGGAAGGEDEELPAPHELGEELKFTGRCGREGGGHYFSFQLLKTLKLL